MEERGTLHDVKAEIIIPVHKLDRPIRRAVESVLQSPRAGCVIVAHGVNPHDLDLPDDARLCTVTLEEGIGYPGFAFNSGLQAATAPFVGVMGSDDWFDCGAIDSMLRRIERTRSDGVLAPLRHAASSKNNQNPVTWRRTSLRARQDRLFFRTAPLGLFARSVFDQPRYLFDDDVTAGVDQRNGALLYTSGFKIAHFPNDPAYVVGDDAKTRVTTTVRPLAEHAIAWRRLWRNPDILALPAAERTALAEKFLQVHVLGMIAARPSAEQWLEGDFEWLSDLARDVVSLAPRANRCLVRARQRILDSLIEGDLQSTLQTQVDASYTDWRLPLKPLYAFHSNFWMRVRVDAALSRARDFVARRRH